ncbi:MAG: heme ABC exporter ATP-binding protein CcmA [Thermincola sp.]|nr:heme ABC exporter ATP-binding protein CcmA [Thermincola sp.]
MLEPLVKMNEVTKIYEGIGDDLKVVVNRVSFSINRGEIFGLLGPNGAGKTTLLKILLGLTEPSSGQVLINGMEVNRSREVKKLIAYVPEKVTFYSNLSALETLHFYSDLKGLPRSQCLKVLERVGLVDFAGVRVGTFSKGMSQRVGVAQALLGKPRLLVLDEPTSGLDPVGVVEFKQLIQELNREGITILFTSHIMSEVEELAQRIGIMQSGKVRAIDSISGLKARMGLLPRLEIKLKVPSQQLIAAVLAAGAADAELENEILRVICRPELKAEVLAAVGAAGSQVMDLRTFEPSLEEVFIRFLSEQEKTTA